MTQDNLSVLKAMISPQSFKQNFSVKVFHVYLDFIYCSAHLCFKKSDLIPFIFLLFTYVLLYLLASKCWPEQNPVPLLLFSPLRIQPDT